MPVQRDPFYPSPPDGLSESLVAFSSTFGFYCLNFHCFPAEEKGERITLHFSGYLKRKGTKKKKKFSPERKVLTLFWFFFFFFLITCRGRPRPLGWRGSSPSLSACCIQARWRGTTRVRPMGTNLPFCSLPKASLIAVGPTLPYRRSLPEGEGTGRFKERKKEEKKEEKARENIPFLSSSSQCEAENQRERKKREHEREQKINKWPKPARKTLFLSYQLLQGAIHFIHCQVWLIAALFLMRYNKGNIL